MARNGGRTVTTAERVQQWYDGQEEDRWEMNPDADVIEMPEIGTLFSDGSRLLRLDSFEWNDLGDYPWLVCAIIEIPGSWVYESPYISMGVIR
jgi:hypothetical protein